ncbi:unnamed protein product [marine sediment metagenome]|uniref:Uncharacterized protein n=1 Tax=marine sediment metagenome TaxID=412755 RepID=X0T1L1_9ZZZZ
MTRALIIALVLLFAPCTPLPVAADDDTPTQLLLARAYIGEAGWYSRRDHEAIYWAIANRATMRGVSFRVQLLAYAKGIERDWVGGLQEDGLGEAWPEEYDREVYAPLWRRALVFAATDLVFAPENPCNGDPEHWGGMRIRRDRLRANRAVEDGRWQPLACGGTRNRFYAVRGRRRAPEPLAVGPGLIVW